MLKKLMVIGILFSLVAGARADYIEDRKAAMALVKAGKTEEALVAFNKMAEGPITAYQKSDALEQAVLCALNLKRSDQAMKLAGTIPLQPVSKLCQMRILTADRQWQALIDQFKDEDLNRWPDSLAGEAFQTRGDTYAALKNGPAAAADLKKATEYLTDVNSLGLALTALGGVYENLLKDDDLALETYRKVYAASTVYKHASAAMAAAGILQRRNKADEAIRELDTIDIKEMAPCNLRAATLNAYADAYAAQGKKAEAIAKYKEVLNETAAEPWRKEACEKQIKALEAALK
jgi:tetratricopeptide (TPR) repeat protein